MWNFLDLFSMYDATRRWPLTGVQTGILAVILGGASVVFLVIPGPLWLTSLASLAFIAAAAFSSAVLCRRFSAKK
jgi:hypothetical protein